MLDEDGGHILPPTLVDDREIIGDTARRRIVFTIRGILVFDATIGQAQGSQLIEDRSGQAFPFGMQLIAPCAVVLDPHLEARATTGIDMDAHEQGRAKSLRSMNTLRQADVLVGVPRHDHFNASIFLKGRPTIASDLQSEVLLLQ